MTERERLIAFIHRAANKWDRDGRQCNMAEAVADAILAACAASPGVEVLEKAAAQFQALPPEEQAKMIQAQRESFVRGEQSWGDESTRSVPTPRPAELSREAIARAIQGGNTLMSGGFATVRVAAAAERVLAILPPAREAWTCAARKSVGANDPQDCNWPVCGCDPHADKVIAALEESVAPPAREAPAAGVVEALRACAEAVDFFDKVTAASTSDKIAVGTDHWSWIESACRKAAALSREPEGRG